MTEEVRSMPFHGRPSGRPCIAVIGAGQCPPEVARLAEDVGRRVAQLPADLVCGGLGGVMEAAARGARLAGGLTIGILPGIQREASNPFVDIVIPTGMGQARNVIVVLTADVVVAVGGEFGTLSEISLALKHGIPVVGVETWPVDRLAQQEGAPFYRAHDPEEALTVVRRLLAASPGRREVGGGEDS